MKYLLPSLLFAISANATTYYIDYSTGSDANDGISRSTPWKRHPYMSGYSGWYSHAPVDRFLFKGGVTWPRSCFQLHITQGGSSDSNRDYYGVANDWYVGSAWSAPVFDFEDTLIGYGWNSSAGIWVERAN